MAAPAPAKTHWRRAKWNGSPRFIRAAAAGLAAKDIRTPRTSNTATAPRSHLSIVHHQTPIGDRSERAKAWCAGFWLMRSGPRRLGVGQLEDGAPEGFAPGLEVCKLVEGGAGRRQEDDSALP